MSGPDPAVAATRNAVRSALQVIQPAQILIGVSGGPDSLALAAATAFVVKNQPVRAQAVVVDHGMQPGSDAVAARAAQQCQDLGIGAEIVSVQVNGTNEAAARSARYQAFQHVIERKQADVLLLGHTQDDQAEQVLLSLARGSGIRAISAMAVLRDRYMRPFLTITRSQTETACAAQGIEAWADPMNKEGLRAQVRHELLPHIEQVLGSGIRAALARTADQAREVQEVVDQAATILLASNRDDAGWAVGPFLDALPGVRRAALRVALIQDGVPPGSLTAHHIETVEELITNWHGQGPIDVPGNRAVLRQGQVIMIIRRG